MRTLTMISLLLLTAPALAGDEDYELGPDSMRQENVPQGNGSDLSTSMTLAMAGSMRSFSKGACVPKRGPAIRCASKVNGPARPKMSVARTAISGIWRR